MWCKHLASLLGQAGQIQAGSGQKVLWLSNVHPESLEIEAVKFSGLAHFGECLLFDRGWSELDAFEDGWVEDVDTGVDSVADKLDWLLDESVDAGAVARLVHNDTILGWFLDLGDDDGSLVAVSLVESNKLLEWVIADDIAVEHEEGLVVLEEGLFGELEGTGSAEWFRLDGEFDLDVEAFLELVTVSTMWNIPESITFLSSLAMTSGR
jgi:hypothetical protein